MSPQRLREQWPRHGGVMERGRVKLHELDIRARHPGAKGHRQTIAGRFRRIGGDRKQLPGATSGKDDVSRSNRSSVAFGRERNHSLDPVVSDHQVGGEAVLGHEGSTCPRGLHQCALDLSSGGRAPGVEDPSAGMTTFASKRESARVLSIEDRTKHDELLDTPRSLIDQDPHSINVAEPCSSGQGVRKVQIS